MKNSTAATGAVLALCALLAGCNNTPFVPIEVPDRSALRPEPRGNPAHAEAELRALQQAAPPEYLIGPGDTFALVVEDNEKLCRPQVAVLPDGTVSLSPIGTVKIGGLTVARASALLNEKYAAHVRDCRVTLEPLEMKQYTFTIGGTVTAPGIYPFAYGSCRLSDAVAMARGVLSVGNTGEKIVIADLENAYIARNGRILPVDFVKALERGDQLHNIPILNGDYIYIPSQESGKITVLGEVFQPDCFPYQANLTLLQSIALAGGLKETNSNMVKVIRGGLKNPVVFNINVKDLQLGRAMDFALRPRDIVFVPRDAISEWNVIIRQLLPSMQIQNTVITTYR